MWQLEWGGRGRVEHKECVSARYHPDLRLAELGGAHRAGAKGVAGNWQSKLQGPGSEREVRLVTPLGATLPLTPCTLGPTRPRVCMRR